MLARLLMAQVEFIHFVLKTMINVHLFKGGGSFCLCISIDDFRGKNNIFYFFFVHHQLDINNKPVFLHPLTFVFTPDLFITKTALTECCLAGGKPSLWLLCCDQAIDMWIHHEV